MTSKTLFIIDLRIDETCHIGVYTCMYCDTIVYYYTKHLMHASACYI